MVPLLFSAAMALGADCPGDVRGDDLVAMLQAADERWKDLDTDGFLDVLRDVEQRLPCVTDEVSPALAAELHRHVGLRAFIHREPNTAKAAFASARAIEPDYTFPEDMVPVGNPVLEEYTALAPEATPVEALAPAAKGRLQIDGLPAQERPTARPVVFQHLGDDGAAFTTAYVLPGRHLPAYDERSEAPVAPARSGNGARTAWSVVAVASGGIAAASWAGSLLSRKQYDGATEPDTLDRLYRRTNALTVTSAGAAVVATSAGAAAVISGRF